MKADARFVRRPFLLWGAVFGIAFALSLLAPSAAPAQSSASIDSAQRSLEYLRNVMDEFHTRFPVYDDVSSPGNHFHAWAKIPSATAPVEINGTWTNNPRSGATCIRCVFRPQPGAPAFGGFYFQNGTLEGQQRAPQPNFGTVPNAGINLTGATQLTFWVRGAVGGEQVEFFVAGVGRDADSGIPMFPYPDSSPRRPARGTRSRLSTQWELVTIDLSGMDLSYVLGGFGWVADVAHNPNGAEFFIDKIQYRLNEARLEQRLNQPRFLRSFSTLPVQPDPFDANRDDDFDFVLRNTAFAYDNALAVLAFLGDGSSDSRRRARLIGDAFVYAMQHDRTFNDNRTCDQSIDPLSPDGARVRTAYAAGDLALPPGWTPNGRIGTVGSPGFYHEATQTFYEVEQQAIDSGNNLWALIALNALYQRTGLQRYLDAACKLGNFVDAFRNTSGTYRGFTGGVDSPESSPKLRVWASTEHQLDANAAFKGLRQSTQALRWRDAALHAREFVEQMWDITRNCYLTGTVDPSTRNSALGMLPVDVQAWSILSLPSPAPHPNALDCAETNHLNNSDGFTGVDFNDDRDGVWFEGTAQMAVAEARAGRLAMKQLFKTQLRLAQQTSPFGNQFGIAAASHDGLSTGFMTAGGDPFKYFRRLHVGATAWNVFAQLNLNPYYSRTLTVFVSGGGVVTTTPSAPSCASTCSSAWIDGVLVTLSAQAAIGWRVESWSGICAGAGTECTIPMTEARETAVSFVPQ